MDVNLQDAQAAEWIYEAPTYWITLWEKVAPEQWHSTTLSVNGAASVEDALVYARTNDTADQFTIDVVVPGKPVGVIRIFGSDPLLSDPLTFHNHSEGR